MITKLNHLIEHAEKKQYAVAGFNVSNIKEAEQVLKVAEKRKESVVLQYSADYENVTPLKDFGPKLVDLAKNSTCDVALMIQHEKNIDVIKEAFKMGFNCVMVDVSGLDKSEAIKVGKNIVDIAKTADANIEVRLGGPNETVEFAKDFVKEVDIDYIACSMSDSAGVDVNSIRTIKNDTNLPLVMHMTKLVNKDQIKSAIQAGIRKVNFHFDDTNVIDKTEELMALVSSH